MVKIVIRKTARYQLFTVLLLLMVSACNSIKMVTITNNTDENVNFVGQFQNNNNINDDLEFALKPGGVNSWHYEIGEFEEDQLDKGLKTIVLTNIQGCKVTLDRDNIEKIAEKNGMWKISINNSIMNCD